MVFKPVDKVHNPIMNGDIFLSMLKNHLDDVSYATSMPPICGGWFLTIRIMFRNMSNAMNNEGISFFNLVLGDS